MTGNGLEWFDNICLAKREFDKEEITVISETDNKSKKFYSESFEDEDGWGGGKGFDRKVAGKGISN